MIDLRRRFPHGAPSLRTTSLTVEGDVRFGRTSLPRRGAPGQRRREPLVIEDGAVITGG